MGPKNHVSILCFLLVSSVVVSAQICVETAGSFRANSTYDINRSIILSSLASNVTARNGFFYNASIGQDPHRVFAVGMCTPGAEARLCSDCIRTTSDNLIKNCPNITEAYSWSGDETLCMVRYANRSFLGSVDLEPQRIVYNEGDMTGNLTEFNRIWEALMLSLAATASSSGASEQKYYAVNVTSWTNFLRIYALMQCIPDISPGDCNNCLQVAVGDYQTCCSRKQGGVVRRPICFFRWDLYPFLGAFGNITSSPLSQPSPSTDDHVNTTKKDDRAISMGTIVAIVVPTGVIVALLALGFVVWRRRKSYKPVEFETDEDITAPHSLQFDFKTIEAATNRFSARLGEGGFGEVYKA